MGFFRTVLCSSARIDLATSVDDHATRGDRTAGTGFAIHVQARAQ
jgi:hypothetical protein